MTHRNDAAAYPAILDVTKETIAEYPGMHVIRDTAGRVIALCPLHEEKVCEDQFSFAPIVHRALNGMANGLEEAARFIETHEILDSSYGQTVRERHEGNRAGLAYAAALRSMSAHEEFLLAFEEFGVENKRREAELRAPVPREEPISCYVSEMKTSAGTDYFVTVRCGDRMLTPHMHKIRSRVEYGVAEWNWLFNGGEKPDILAYREEGETT
jgi:hypothetical protein